MDPNKEITGMGGITTIAEEIIINGYLKGSGYRVNPFIYNWGSMYLSQSEGKDKENSRPEFSDIASQIDQNVPMILYSNEHFNVPMGYISDNNTGNKVIICRDSNYRIEAYNFERMKTYPLITFIKE